MWIESHQSLANHPKVKKLARLLSVDKPTIIGHLHLLWWWSLDYADDGKLIPPYDEGDVCDAMEWPGDARKLVDALMEVGFLERVSDTIVVHDWYDYAGKLLEKREKDRQRKAAKRKG